MCIDSGTHPKDSQPQQPDQQQLQGRPTDGSMSRGPVSRVSSPGCRLVFDIDSDNEGLPESAHLTEQLHEYTEHSSGQTHMPQQQQQAPQQQDDWLPTSEPAITHGIVTNETSEGCQLVFDIESGPEESAEQPQHQQQQQGCRLVFDIDSDPQGSAEQQLQQDTWQPTVQSHGRSGDSPPSCPFSVSMSRHESQLPAQQPLGASDVVHHHLSHDPQASLVSHGIRFDTPGSHQLSQTAQTPRTVLTSVQSPWRPLANIRSQNAAGHRLQHSSSDAQASSPYELMQHQETNHCWSSKKNRHAAAVDQQGPLAAGGQEDDSCPLVFEEEEQLDIIQEEEEELDVIPGQCGLASTGLQHQARTTAVTPRSTQPYPHSNPNLHPHSQPNPHPHLDPHPHPRRQQSLQGMPHGDLMQPDPLHLEHEHDSCPLVFTTYTGQEQHFMAGTDHDTSGLAYRQTPLAHTQGQFQNSPAQPSQRSMLEGTSGSAQLQPDRMAGHMPGHMANNVADMHRNNTANNTHLHDSVTEAGGRSVSDNAQRLPAGESWQSWKDNETHGADDSCDVMHIPQVLALYTFQPRIELDHHTYSHQVQLNSQ